MYLTSYLTQLILTMRSNYLITTAIGIASASSVSVDGISNTIASTGPPSEVHARSVASELRENFWPVHGPELLVRRVLSNRTEKGAMKSARLV